MKPNHILPLYSKDPFYYYPPIYAYVFRVICSLQDPQTKFRRYFLSHERYMPCQYLVTIHFILITWRTAKLRSSSCAIFPTSNHRIPFVSKHSSHHTVLNFLLRLFVYVVYLTKMLAPRITQRSTKRLLMSCEWERMLNDAIMAKF
jgi:hypothetical protein